MLFGLWGFYEVRGDLQTARELAEQLLALADREQDPALLLQGHRALGDTLVWLGQFVLARTHLEQGIALYNPERHKAHAALYGQDPGIGAGAMWPECYGYWVIRIRPCRRALKH